jgi:hypothetical protein
MLAQDPQPRGKRGSASTGDGHNGPPSHSRPREWDPPRRPLWASRIEDDAAGSTETAAVGRCFGIGSGNGIGIDSDANAVRYAAEVRG